METVQKYYISLILLSYKVMKKTALIFCTVNQSGTGHKIHFQPKHPARAKLAAINNKKWLWHGWGVMETVQKCFIPLKISYKVRKNIALLCCTVNQVSTGHKLHFHIKNPSWAKRAAINNNNGCGTAEVWCRQFRSISYHWYYHII